MSKVKDANTTKPRYNNLAWYITRPTKQNNYSPVIDSAGNPVDLNTEESDDDYEFYKRLSFPDKGKHFMFMYECIVFAHNLKNGHIPMNRVPPTEQEAADMVRILFYAPVKLACGTPLNSPEF